MATKLQDGKIEMSEYIEKKHINLRSPLLKHNSVDCTYSRLVSQNKSVYFEAAFNTAN